MDGLRRAADVGRPRMTIRVLVADDRREVFEAVRLLLRPEGFEVVPAGSPAAVLEAIASSDQAKEIEKT